MPGTIVQPSVLVARSLPQAFPDGVSPPGPPRADRYSGQYVQSLVPTKHVLADQGSYFVAGMLNGATTLQAGISASYSAITFFLALQNTDTPGNPNAKRCYLDFLKFIVATAGTSGTNLLYNTVVDSNRVPTLSALGTPTTATAYKAPAVNVNMDSGAQPIGQALFPQSTAAGVPPAVSVQSPNARSIVGNGALRNTIVVVNDEFRITFGAADYPYVVIPPATITKAIEPHPPVVIGPGQIFLFSMWSASNVTAGNAVSDLQLAWWEM